MTEGVELACEFYRTPCHSKMKFNISNNSNSALAGKMCILGRERNVHTGKAEVQVLYKMACWYCYHMFQSIIILINYINKG